MTPDQAFIDAIIESPDDDTPRLIYADFLEGRGESDRAEFIRLQCQLAQMSEEDARRDGLEARESELLTAHRDKWLGAVRSMNADTDLPAIGGGHCFRRGLLEEVTLSAATFLEHNNVIFRANPIQRLTVTNAEHAMRQLAESSCLGRLSELNFDFWFSQCTPPIDGFRALLASPHLGHLRGLGFSGHPIRYAALEALVSSPLLGQLSRLDLGAAQIGSLGIALLASTPSLKGLTSFELSNNAVKLPDVRLLANCRHLAGLKRFSLRFSYVGEGCGEALAASPYLTNLNELILSESDLGDAGLAALANSRNVTQLKKLLVDDNGLSADGVRSLTESPYLRQLTELFLSNNVIKDDGAQMLASSSSMCGLKRLYLDNCGITDVGAQALAESSALNGLRCLYLSSSEDSSGAANVIGISAKEALIERFGNRVRL